MDRLALAVERLDRLQFPSDISFRPKDGAALAAAIRPAAREAARELPEPHLALLARRRGDPAHARAERRLLAALFAGRRPARLHLRPDDQGQGRSLRPRGRRGAAARRHSRHDRGSALDERRRGDRRARRRSRPRRRRDQRRGAPLVGRRRGSGGHQSDGCAPAAVQGRRCRRGDDEVGPTDSASGSSTCSATTRAVALVSADPSERGWYHARLVTARLRHARRRPAASDRDWQLQVAVGIASGKQRRLPRRLVERPRPGRGEIRVLDLATRQGLDASPPPRRRTSRVRLARRREPVVRRLVEARLDLRRGRSTERSNGSSTRTPSSARTAFRAQISPAPDKKGFAAVRETVGAPPEIVFKAHVRRRLEARHALNGAIAARASRLSRGPRRRAGRARTAWRSKACVLLPRDRAAGPLPTIVDIHGGPSWAAKTPSIPATRCRSRRPATRCSCRTIAAISAGARPSRGSISAIPGGAEFDDILAGIDRCVAEGFADPDAARRHRRQLWRLHDRLGGRDHRPLQGRGHGLRHLPTS